MKSLLTTAFCLVAICTFSQTVHCGNVTWEVIERRVQQHQLSHPVIKKINDSAFYKHRSRFTEATINVHFRCYLRISKDSCENPPQKNKYELPPDISQILKDHPFKVYKDCSGHGVYLVSKTATQEKHPNGK